MNRSGHAVPSRSMRVVLRAFLCAGLLLCAGSAIADVTSTWFVNGRPAQMARDAVNLLQAAKTEGLNPSDYSAESLALGIDRATQTPLTPDEQARLSASMTKSLERFVSDLHYGRVDPREVHAKFETAARRLDPKAHVANAMSSPSLTAAILAAAPQLPFYATLRQTLAHYRKLENDPALNPVLPIPARKVVPGDAYQGVATLARKLIALGDLPGDTVIPGRYEGPLVEGVKAFQRRHGLTEDGVLGRTTLEQLNVPMSARVRQIELSMERLRWTPLQLSNRMIAINLPEFVLRAYEISDNRFTVKETMNVIVGKSLNTRTPLFYEDMRFIEFSPYWNVPRSIAKDETIPKLRRDPGYFQRQGMEFVGSDGRVVTAYSPANLDAVLAGKMRIRQRPGRHNALGDIKFIFPNNANIYLHHTPSVNLFKRDRRDFSHGCIRVEHPVGLAKFVLQDEPEWTEERIRSAMSAGKSRTIRLKQTVPVVIVYVTAIVKRDGKVYFFRDIYNHDQKLDMALNRRSSKR